MWFDSGIHCALHPNHQACLQTDVLVSIEHVGCSSFKLPTYNSQYYVHNYIQSYNHTTIYYVTYNIIDPIDPIDNRYCMGHVLWPMAMVSNRHDSV